MGYGHQRLGEDKLILTIMRHTGPKNRLARREGIDLGLKTVGSKSYSNLMKKINIIPGQHGTRRSRGLTDYGQQLREKQKIKRLYGLTERQMKNYFTKAVKSRGNTAEKLVQLLERRLDNVIYRLSFAPTRSSSRQLVGHGHITVNDKKVTIASFLVSVDDKIGFKNEKTTNIPYIKETLSKTDTIIPSWLEIKKDVARISVLPSATDFKDDVELQLVVEFYSR